MSLSKTINGYYWLTKPGIVRSNVMTAAAGFLFASAGAVAWGKFIWVMIGTTLVIASACVINNIIDRGIDSKMERTKKRAVVTGQISIKAANIYAVVMGSLGISLLVLFANVLTAATALICTFFYVVIYGYSKRTSIHSTLVGSVVGGLLPVAGYTAVSGKLDVAAGLLFLALAAWQMPHFYAIAIFRRKEYAAAGLPILSVVKGVPFTKLAIQLWTVLFFVAASSLYFFGYASVVYQAVILALSLYWLRYALAKPDKKDHILWSKRVFGASFIVLMAYSLIISIDGWLFF